MREIGGHTARELPCGRESRYTGNYPKSVRPQLHCGRWATVQLSPERGINCVPWEATMQWPCSKEIKYQAILGLLLVAVSTGCVAWGWRVAPTPTPTLEPTLIDWSILTGLPCAAPCWYGLEVGRSTKSDILATARPLSFIDPRESLKSPTVIPIHRRRRIYQLHSFA